MIFCSSVPTNRHCVPIPQPPPIAAMKHLGVGMIIDVEHFTQTRLG
ncbi:hypothetical protein AAZX31_02G097400 [Glycine max]